MTEETDKKPAKITKLSFKGKVQLVEELIQKEHVSGSGTEAVFKDVVIGWQLCLSEPGPLTLIMVEKPPFEKDDVLRISLEKAP